MFFMFIHYKPLHFGNKLKYTNKVINIHLSETTNKQVVFLVRIATNGLATYF